MKVAITRPKQYQDRIRNYLLLVDGENMTEIKPNSSTTVELPENARKIQFKVDWCTSPEFQIENIKNGSIIVKNTMGKNWFSALFLPLYYITFGKGKYLTIESST